MSYERDRERQRPASPDAPATDAAPAGTVGKRTRVQSEYPPAVAVQARGNLDGPSVHAVAARGVAGGGGSLPHLDAIQRSFGRHDVTGVRAHVGGTGAAAATALGATAYATGSDIAFAADPDLHLAAHEAAHVVQQRGGVQLAGGVGHDGDEYEQHADAVADLVVQGKSAESLLDRFASGSGGRSIQMFTAARDNRAVAIVNFLLANQQQGDAETIARAIDRGISDQNVARVVLQFRLRDEEYRLEVPRSDALTLRRECDAADGAVVSSDVASSRATLQVAVQRVADAAQLEAIRNALLARGETPTDHRPVGIAIAQREHAVRPADLGWLLRIVDDRIRAVGAVRADLVDRTVDRVSPEPEERPAGVPTVEGTDRVDPEMLGRAAEIGTFQFRKEFDVGVGTITFELGVNVQVSQPGDRANDRSAPGQTTVTGAIPSGRRTPRLAANVTATPISAVEEYLDAELVPIPGRDHLEIERQGGLHGRYEAEIGWHFGSLRIGDWDIGFRLDLASLQCGERPRFGLTMPITSGWLSIGGGIHAQFNGEVTFQPSIRPLVQWANRVATQLGESAWQGSRAASAEGALARGAAQSEAALARGATHAEGMLARGALTETAAMRAAPTAARVATAGGALATGEIAAGVGSVAAGVALYAALALVATTAIIAVVAPFALLGVLLSGHPSARRGPREDDPNVTLDAALTDTGNQLHGRVVGFCDGYAATMRGEPAAGDPGRDAGRQAATRWIRELESQGHTLEDIHTAARSAPDLAQQVFVVARDTFSRQAEQIAVARFRDRSVPGMNQRREWASRYLRSCITLGPCPRAMPFDFDPCRETPDARGDYREADGTRVDGDLCPPGGESNAEETPPQPTRPEPPWTL
jgi:hypothetical protein